MHLTNNNIKSVEVSEFFIRNFFQDETGNIKITLHNQHTKYFARFIQIDLPNYKIQSVIDEIPPNSYKTVEISFSMPQRGKHFYSKLVLSSKFPFNIFYSWKRISWNESFFSYPAREGAAEPPYTSEDEIKKQMDITSALASASSDNFLGHREYNAYENPKRIDWKVYARKNKFFVKTFESEASHICFIDTNVYLRSISDFDKRLKQLTKWIFEAQKWNVLFVVRLKNDEVTILDDRKKVELIYERLSLASTKDFA